MQKNCTQKHNILILIFLQYNWINIMFIWLEKWYFKLKQIVFQCTAQITHTQTEWKKAFSVSSAGQADKTDATNTEFQAWKQYLGTQLRYQSLRSSLLYANLLLRIWKIRDILPVKKLSAFVTFREYLWPHHTHHGQCWEISADTDAKEKCEGGKKLM